MQALVHALPELLPMIQTHLLDLLSLGLTRKPYQENLPTGMAHSLAQAIQLGRAFPSSSLAGSSPSCTADDVYRCCCRCCWLVAAAAAATAALLLPLLLLPLLWLPLLMCHY